VIYDKTADQRTHVVLCIF